MEEKRTRPEYATLVLIWLGLIVLTAVTVVVAGLNLGKAAILVALGIATIKSMLVIFYFMRLRYERRIVIRILIPIVLITLTIFIGLTYTDILYR